MVIRMAPVSRTAQFAKVHKILKKYYKPASQPAERPVLEHLLFACCLEDARYDAAEEAFAALVHTFFDWNEVRVTSLSELSEVMAALPDPRAAANRLKRVLHGVFEETYCFDLEDVRKKNLGPTVKWLEKVDGTSKFSVAYVVQSALGGHSIPIDAGTMAALRVLDLVTEQDVAEGTVSGLERAISKAKGIEFGSLLHQLGADYSANPFGPQIRDILLQIEPSAAQRFPQRRIPRDTKSDAAPPAKTDAPAGHAAPTAGRKKKTAGAADEPERAAPTPPPAAAGKKTRSTGKAPVPEKHHPAPVEPEKEKSPAEGLAKRKPR
jgi:hypothetical protein